MLRRRFLERSASTASLTVTLTLARTIRTLHTPTASSSVNRRLLSQRYPQRCTSCGGHVPQLLRHTSTLSSTSRSKDEEPDHDTNSDRHKDSDSSNADLTPHDDPTSAPSNPSTTTVVHVDVPQGSVLSPSFSASVTGTPALEVEGEVEPDDIEEPDASRKERPPSSDPNKPIIITPPNLVTENVRSDVPLQGLASDEVVALQAPFTEMEKAALIEDLMEYQKEAATILKDAALTQREKQVKAAQEHFREDGHSTDSQSATSSSSPSPRIPTPPSPLPSTPPLNRAPFLASWSVKEVCSWWMSVREDLYRSTDGSAQPHPPPRESSFLQLLQKHAIDGARLLAFTTDPDLIPLIDPRLLSKILYLRGLDTYSHLFQGNYPSSQQQTRTAPQRPSPPVGCPFHPGEMHTHQPTGQDPNVRDLQTILHSTIKIFCTSTSPDFARPWSQLDQVDSTSSGFVINFNGTLKLLGNAHGATYATQLRVRKHGSPTKYKARVCAISHEADLVLLDVDAPEFWRGLEPLSFGSVPRLQDTCLVVGYPTGGDSVCVTKGVVSRILVSNYVHSDESLLTVQIDAAINSGNSGGPVLFNGSVIGVAFQGVSSAQSVGYIIPTPVILHFLHDLTLHHGRYTGFPSLYGLSFQKLENESARKYLGLTQSEQSGIVVMDRAPLDDAAKVLQADDVVTHIDGMPVAEDGSIHFRTPGERISCRYLASAKFVGDHIRMRIVRRGTPMEVSFILGPKRPLVPTHLYDQQPSYYILAGLVFTVLSRPYLQDCFGKSSWVKRSPVDLIKLAYYGVLEQPDQQVVILSTILVDDVNSGYGGNFHNIVLTKVNGKPIRNIRHLVEIVENERDAGVPFLRFDFTLNRVIILETELAFESTRRILKQNAIEYDRSEELRQATNQVQGDVQRK